MLKLRGECTCNIPEMQNYTIQLPFSNFSKNFPSRKIVYVWNIAEMQYLTFSLIFQKTVSLKSFLRN